GGVGARRDLMRAGLRHGHVLDDADVQADVLLEVVRLEDADLVLLDELLHRLGGHDRRTAEILALPVPRQQDAALAVEQRDSVADVLAVLRHDLQAGPRDVEADLGALDDALGAYGRFRVGLALYRVVNADDEVLVLPQRMAVDHLGLLPRPEGE